MIAVFLAAKWLIGYRRWGIKMLFILDGKEPVPVSSIKEWACWMEKLDNRIVKTEDLDELGGMSTLFMGFPDPATGCFFETAWFDTQVNVLDSQKYTTWDEALRGHQEMVNRARGEE